MQVAPTTPHPDNRKRYRRTEADGVEVFTNLQLVQIGDQVRISLGGFWKFRWIRVWGLHSAAACMV